MKVKVRVAIQDTPLRGYRNFIIDVLVRISRYSNYYTIAGSIKFQADENTLKTDEPWYGRTYEISTDEVKHLAYMTKVAKFLADNSHSRDQPETILNILSAEEFVMYDYEFVSIKNNGMNYYDVIQPEKSDGEDVYTRIYSSNDITAQNYVDRRYKDCGFTVRLKEGNVKLVSNIK